MTHGHIIHTASLMILTCALMLSCDKEESIQNTLQTETSIDLLSPIISQETKGRDPYENDNLDNFSISAILNYDGASGNQWYLPNSKVEKDKVSNQWAIKPTAYWPMFGDLSFFAYAPCSKNYPGIRFVETVTGMPKVEYTPSTTDIDGQVDFCIGRPVMHYTKDDGLVPVRFEHALTYVKFCANYIGVVPAGCFVLINKLKIKNVVGTKNVTMSDSAPFFVWEDESAHSADTTYVLERLKNHIGFKYDSLRISTGALTDIDTLTQKGGRLYLLPQTLGPDAKLEVEYGFYYGSTISPDTLAIFSKDISLPTDKPWPVGKTVYYMLTLDVGISSPLKLVCNIEDWISSGNTHPEFEFE